MGTVQIMAFHFTILIVFVDSDHVAFKDCYLFNECCFMIIDVFLKSSKLFSFSLRVIQNTYNFLHAWLLCSFISWLNETSVQCLTLPELYTWWQSHCVIFVKFDDTDLCSDWYYKLENRILVKCFYSFLLVTFLKDNFKC